MRAVERSSEPYVLVLCGCVEGPPGFETGLVDYLDAHPLVDAVSAVSWRKGTQERLDGGWRFDWREHGVQPVACAGSDPPAVGGTCVLVRARSVTPGLLGAGYCGAAWALDLSLAARHAGRGVAVAPVEVWVDGGGEAIAPSDIQVLCRRWGPLLRQKVLDDLLWGGGRWCDRGLRVHFGEPLDAGQESCFASGWTQASADRADVRIDAEGRTLRARWRDDDRRCEPGSVLCRDETPVDGEALRRLLAEHLERPTVCLQTAARDWPSASTSGDVFLARALARALRAQGCWTRLQVRDESGDPRGAALDVVVNVRGRGRLHLPPGQRRVMWHISHPDEVALDELADYDLVAVASRPHAAVLANQVDVPVRELLQFTDPAVFAPAADESPGHEVLFVGNWRSVFRRAVWSVLPTNRDLGLYGQGWRYLAPEHARGDHVPNEELHRLYSSAGIVLADHWDDMRRHGFVSNRICDALASGGFVICDDFPALEVLFAGGLETFSTREDLRAKIERYLGDPGARASVARRGRQLVLESHTADRRATELLTFLQELDVATPRRPADRA